MIKIIKLTLIVLFTFSCNSEKGKNISTNKFDFYTTYKYINNSLVENNIFIEHYYPNSRNRNELMKIIINDSIHYNAIKFKDCNIIIIPDDISDKEKIEKLSITLKVKSIEKIIKKTILTNYKHGIIGIIKTSNEIIFQSCISDSTYTQVRKNNVDYKDILFNKQRTKNSIYGIRYIFPISNSSIEIYNKTSTTNYLDNNLYYARRQVFLQSNEQEIIECITTETSVKSTGQSMEK